MYNVYCILHNSMGCCNVMIFPMNTIWIDDELLLCWLSVKEEGWNCIVSDCYRWYEYAGAFSILYLYFFLFHLLVWRTSRSHTRINKNADQYHKYSYWYLSVPSSRFSLFNLCGCGACMKTFSDTDHWTIGHHNSLMELMNNIWSVFHEVLANSI